MNQQLFTANRKKGFTLVELLVVMVIIGLLATITIVSVTTVKSRARDARRKQDIKQLQAALILYSRDNGGTFPICAGSISAGLPYCNLFDMNPNIDPTYINPLPVDPNSNISGLAYNYSGVIPGTSFEVVACLENANDKDKDPTTSFACAASGAAASYTLRNPN